VVDSQHYIYDEEYQGWIETGPRLKVQSSPDAYWLAAGEFSLPIRLLSQFGAVPRKTSQEVVQGRQATRYDLDYVIGELTETFADKPGRASTDLQGTIWIDDETGALLRLEVFFYESKEREEPTQEFLLEVSQIGNITPIVSPAPVVDPEAIVSATATAQAWTALQVSVSYREELVQFELVPVQMQPGSGGTGARMELILRRLPGQFLLEPEAEQFLTQLREQLRLSIPKNNLVVMSSGFQINQIDADHHLIEVVYFFDTSLEDFSHVELILSGSGNPLVAPVPVASHN
jgi:hypothetical protein